jgi:hypothetical protein
MSVTSHSAAQTECVVGRAWRTLAVVVVVVVVDFDLSFRWHGGWRVVAVKALLMVMVGVVLLSLELGPAFDWRKLMKYSAVMMTLEI